MKQNEDYYDRFASWYENDRSKGYHAFLDRMELKIAQPWVENQEVLEAGCGTGLLLKELDRMASKATGVDLSAGMLEKALARGLNAVKGSITELPFPDNSFDTTVSFKVLSHIPDLKKAISEMARVTRPGGHLVLEFYNKSSIRYLVKQLKPAQKVAGDTYDNQVHTAYHSWNEVLALLPPNVKTVDRQGIRIIAPTHHFYGLPIIGKLTEASEEFASTTMLKKLGGFMIGIFEVTA